MNTVLTFDHVSKQYRLGVTRTSLLSTISNSLKRAAKQKHAQPESDQYLWALRDVSFKLAKGESLALIGRNGAGKSTILKLLANITRPTSGSIDVTGRLSALIELGAGFHHDLTGRENIFLNGTILGLSRSEIQSRFDEIVAFSEIENFIETPIKRYSSGMLVRLGFAVASCIEPDILLVDEVLAVGDASFRQKCLQRIQHLLDNGTSIIFVSHNLYMVQAVCPKALYLENGQVKHRGETQEVIDAYERDLHEERAQKFDLERLEQKDFVSDVQIVRIEVLDEDGTRQDEFSSDQPVELRIHYQTFGATGRANAAVRLVRADGLVCCMMRTTLDGLPLTLQKEGTISVFLEELQLTGGNYFVEARITNENDNVILASGSSDWFYVSGVSLSHVAKSGVFEPKRRWEQDLQVPQTVVGHDAMR